MRIKSMCKYKRQIKQQAQNNSTVNTSTHIANIKQYIWCIGTEITILIELRGNGRAQA